MQMRTGTKTATPGKAQLRPRFYILPQRDRHTAFAPMPVPRAVTGAMIENHIVRRPVGGAPGDLPIEFSVVCRGNNAVDGCIDRHAPIHFAEMAQIDVMPFVPVIGETGAIPVQDPA